MYIPNWGAELITGNPKIDEEHQELFSRIDALMIAMSHSREQAVIEETLNYLMQYAKNHFKEEEAMHRKCQAPFYESHVLAHRKISTDLDEILRVYQTEGLTPHMEFRLINHVIRGIVDQLHEYDLPLSKFLQMSATELSE